MEHYIDSRKTYMLGFIEILNDIGLSILYIDRTFYVFSEFQPPDPSIDVNYSSILGINITSEVENAIQKEGYTEQMKTELSQKIGVMPYRKREFSANMEWKKYIAKTQ